MSFNLIKLLVVGNPQTFHIGSHFFKASESLGIDVHFVDITNSFGQNRFIQTLLWKYCGRYPQYLDLFSCNVVLMCKKLKISHIISTGVAPLNINCILELKKLGIITLNYLTDDPWNEAHKAPWFITGLPYYNAIFTTRRANISDLKKIGCNQVYYCPFAFQNELHKFPLGNTTDSEGKDVVFVGGADLDRIKIIKPLLDHHFNVVLYGGYWEKKHPFTKFSGGNVNLEYLANVSQESKITLCLVRRANRDGHVMRSYEAAASAACMLVEDTVEHREIFGEDGVCVVYFNSNEQMISRARWLLDHSEERLRLRQSVYRRIVLEGKNTYVDRLRTILETIGEKV